ncbi:MAG: ABC transporter permease [Rhizobiaceae bacterium]
MDAKIYLTTPALFVAVFFLVVPLGTLGYISLMAGYPLVDDPTVSLQNYSSILTDSFYLYILLKTIAMAVLITAVSLLFAYPVAHFLAKTQSKYKSLLLLAVILPLFVGNAVRAIGWMLLLGEQGVVNKLLQFVGLGGPYTFMYTTSAVVLGAAAVNIPFLILTIQSVMEQLNPSVEEASISLGATPLTTWRLVTLPLVAHGLLAACTLSFILSMNAYATPLLLGGPGFAMMAPTIAIEILQKSNWSMGAALAFIMIVVTLALTMLLNRALKPTIV